MTPHADLLFTGGPVLTMEGSDAEALAVADGRILAVGAATDVDAFRGPGTRVVDLAGRALLPGFVDAHTHFVQAGIRKMRLDLSRVRSKDEALQAVIERVKMTPAGGWVVGHSWDDSKWTDHAWPTRADLDRVAPNNPVLLSRVDRHSGVLNSKGLEAVGADPAAHPDGALYEDTYNRACDRVVPALSTHVHGIVRMNREAARLGVTSVVVMTSRDDWRALQAAKADGKLGVRVTAFAHLDAVEPALERAEGAGGADADADDGLPPAGWSRGTGDAWLHMNGIKLYADGSIGSRTAATDRAYDDDPHNHGQALYDDETLRALVKRAHAVGLQCAVHAIGDRAIGQVLDAFEDADGTKVPPARHRIEHAELFTDAQAERMARLGVVASMQPNFVGEWGHAGEMYAQRLGDDIVPQHNRFPALLAAGVRLAFGSDDMPFGPLYGLHHAVNGPTPEQSLPVEDALRAYTLGAAEANFTEDEVGSLKEGKRADLVVLSEDPRQAADRLADLRVDMTVVDGRVVWQV